MSDSAGNTNSAEGDYLPESPEGGDNAAQVGTSESGGPAGELSPQLDLGREQILQQLFPGDGGMSDGNFFEHDGADSEFLSAGEPTLAEPEDIVHAFTRDVSPDSLTPIFARWVDRPYAFVILYKTEDDNGYLYLVVEPTLDEFEQLQLEALKRKLRSEPLDRYDPDASAEDRARQIQTAATRIMDGVGMTGWLPNEGILERAANFIGGLGHKLFYDGDARRTELDERTQAKLVYYLTRDFAFYDRINPLMEAPGIEDIHCNGAGTEVYVNHSAVGENVPTNVLFETETQLRRFVTRMAQRVGQDVSESSPTVNASLPDGSRAQMNLGDEVSDNGSHFTFRKFNEVPSTPVDLINWETYEFERVAYLWLIMEYGHSVIFSGGTGAGKTTSLNAMSLFIPADKKIVSIEDTREIEIPHQNWIRSVTRESSGGNRSSIDEQDLLQDALRQRPERIIMGEIRGEEGRDAVEAMNTGHQLHATFHAGSDRNLVFRMTQGRIDADRTGLGDLDVIVQQTNFEGERRCTQIVEIDEYDATNEEYSTQEVFSYHRPTDTFRRRKGGVSTLLDGIRKDENWSKSELEAEIDRRAVVLAYLVSRGIKSYRNVATVLQGYMRMPNRVLRYIAEDSLAENIEELAASMDIYFDIGREDLTEDRPEPDPRVRTQADTIIARNADLLSQAVGGKPTISVGTIYEDWGDPVRDPPPSGGAFSTERSRAVDLRSSPGATPGDEQTSADPVGQASESDGRAPDSASESDDDATAEGTSMSSGAGGGQQDSSVQADSDVTPSLESTGGRSLPEEDRGAPTADADPGATIAHADGADTVAADEPDDASPVRDAGDEAPAMLDETPNESPDFETTPPGVTSGDPSHSGPPEGEAESDLFPDPGEDATPSAGGGSPDDRVDMFDTPDDGDSMGADSPDAESDSAGKDSVGESDADDQRRE